MPLSIDPKRQIDQALAAEHAKVMVDTFTLGAVGGAGKVEGQLTFDRKWSNGWGAWAYAKAWYYDASVSPIRKSGVGGEGAVGVTKTFKPER